MGGLLMPTLLSGTDYFVRRGAETLVEPQEALEQLEHRLGMIDAPTENMASFSALADAVRSIETVLPALRALTFESRERTDRKVAWQELRKVLIDDFPRIFPVLAAMRMKREGIVNYCGQALTVINRDGSKRVLRREELESKQYLKWSDQLRPHDNAWDLMPDGLRSLGAQASATLRGPLYDVLRRDPEEVGWKKWWSDLFCIRVAFEECGTLEERIAYRLMPEVRS